MCDYVTSEKGFSWINNDAGDMSHVFQGDPNLNMAGIDTPCLDKQTHGGDSVSWLRVTSYWNIDERAAQVFPWNYTARVTTLFTFTKKRKETTHINDFVRNVQIQEPTQ